MRTIVNIKEEPEHLLFKLREDNKIVFKRLPFNNYFYITESDYDSIEHDLRHKKYIKDIEYVQDFKKTKFVKLILVDNTKRNFCKKFIEEEGIQTYLADLTSAKRWILDYHELLNQNGLSICFYDIETFDLRPLIKNIDGSVIADGPILSCAIKDMTGKVIYIKNPGCEDERVKNFIIKYKEYIKTRDKSLKAEYEHDCRVVETVLEEYEPQFLHMLFNEFKNYDVFKAWNGDFFDSTFIKQRADKYGIDIEKYMFVFYDDMIAYKHFTYTSLKSYSLQNVSLHEFKDEVDDKKYQNLSEVQKVDWHSLTTCKKFFEFCLFEPQLFKEYNEQDTHLLYLLESKLKFIILSGVLAELANCPLSDTVWNSKLCDYLMLRKYRTKNIIQISKPNKAQLAQRQTTFIAGAYTAAFLRSFHKNAHVFDYKSMYPTRAITHNISAEVYVCVEYPNIVELLEIFSQVELDYINYCVKVSANYLDTATPKYKFNKKKYEKDIEAKRVELNTPKMDDLMWRFVEQYKERCATEKAFAEDLTYTSADLNYTPRGWKFYPHFYFSRKEEGIFCELSRTILTKRDEVKYSLKEVEDKLDVWMQRNLYQSGLKLIGNSLYGYCAMKASRDFVECVPQGITASSRFLIKSSILFARKLGYDVVLCDTDSAYLVNRTSKLTIQELELAYFNFYKEYFKKYNTRCQIELVNPMTNQKELCNHFTVFENEKTFESLLCIKKKRYYYKLWNDKKKKFIYGTTGGSAKKTDTLLIAAEIQTQMYTDMLDEKFDRDVWKNKILELKNKVYNFELDKKYLVKYQTVSKDVNEYGKKMIDAKTGLPKVTKAGKERFAAIPAQITVAKRMIEQGEDISIGDKIGIIVHSYIDGKIHAISEKEYDEQKTYCVSYYWDRIISVLLELLEVYCPSDAYTFFGECWNYNEKQLKKLIEEFAEEEDDDEDEIVEEE